MRVTNELKFSNVDGTVIYSDEFAPSAPPLEAMCEQGEYSASSASSSCYSEPGSSVSGAGRSSSSSSSSSTDYAESQISLTERLRIEQSFKALATQVLVCSSVANMYVSRGGCDWALEHTGVPVVLLDTGLARARTSRGITIVLAERGSCLALWRDKIDNLSAYKAAGAWHTMCLSTNHKTKIGFSFTSATGAEELWRHIERLTSDPLNICLSVPGSKRNKSHPQPPKLNLPTKQHISQPCCFQHVTSVQSMDISRYASLQSLLPPPTDKHP